jgi:hypothetical protein
LGKGPAHFLVLHVNVKHQLSINDQGGEGVNQPKKAQPDYHQSWPNNRRVRDSSLLKGSLYSPKTMSDSSPEVSPRAMVHWTVLTQSGKSSRRISQPCWRVHFEISSPSTGAVLGTTSMSSSAARVSRQCLCTATPKGSSAPVEREPAPQGLPLHISICLPCGLRWRGACRRVPHSQIHHSFAAARHCPRSGWPANGGHLAGVRGSQ